MIYSKDNLPPHIVKHSPTGMNWGYGGSGPSDLALSLLTAVFGRTKAELFYMDFKWVFVAGWEDDWQISDEAIKEWLKQKLK